MARYIFIFFVACCASNNIVMANAIDKMTSDVNLFEQRTIYQQAARAYRNNNILTYQQLTQQLKNYPLHSYLVSLSLTDSLDSLPYYQVDQFLLANNNTVVGRRLLANWLNVLAEKNHWHEFRSYYSANIRSTRLQCLYLWARLKTADNTAFNEVATLWDVKKSQPKACDPLFEEWIKQGYLTEKRLWSRYKKAVIAKQSGLVKHLQKFAKEDKQKHFNHFKNMHNNPEKVAHLSTPNLLNFYSIDILKHGLTRLQQKKPELALTHYQKHDREKIFPDDYKEAFLAQNKEYKNDKQSLEQFHKIENFKYIAGNNPKSLDSLLLTLVRDKNWKLYLQWYDKLPVEKKESDQWLYWYARALEKINISNSKRYLQAYQSLAKKRSYYGFLAADRLNQPYELENKPLIVENNLLFEINHIPAIARARELFFTNNIRAARWEWRDGTQDFSELAAQASAQLAHEWGWHRKAIEMLSSIKAWDHLAVRFPIVHQDFIEEKAQRFNYPASLIFAIARQESAWQKDATSHAGARGLMQLIPSTARETAKKAGVKHITSKLYTPEHNILLGSFHIDELLEKYNNNRLPAIAAYNAGQHRVNQWIKKSKGKLPFDIWIETIPFRETRKYVKNVLYYSALYDHQSGNKMNLLTTLERETPL